MGRFKCHGSAMGRAKQEYFTAQPRNFPFRCCVYRGFLMTNAEYSKRTVARARGLHVKRACRSELREDVTLR